jgi:hypothetical protein
MHDLVFYAIEYIVITLGAIFIHKFVYNKNKAYDSGSLYLSVLAGSYIWIVVVCIHLFGIDMGFFGGLVAGGIAVAILDSAVGFLHNSGY